MPTARAFVVSLAAFALGAPLTPGSAQAPRPMTFMDQQLMRQAGGAALSPALWALDYNMQSEYTEVSTFVHEFGHSLGLPDVYAVEPRCGQ